MGILKIENPKIELKEIITKSDLSQGQKENWDSFIQVITEQDTISVLRAIQENKDSLNILTENLEEKLIATKTIDKNLWENILKKEKKFLE